MITVGTLKQSKAANGALLMPELSFVKRMPEHIYFKRRLYASNKVLIRSMNTVSNSLSHLFNVRIRGAASNYFCNFLKTTIQQKHQLFREIGQVCGGEKVGFFT